VRAQAREQASGEEEREEGGVCVEVARCGSAGSGVARYVYAAEPNEMSAIELNA
jgi:hypothetical protein